MNTEERKQQAIKQILGLVGEIEDAQGKLLVAFPDHELGKIPLGLALGVAAHGLPIAQAPRPSPHLDTSLNARDYAQLKGALDSRASTLGYPLGVSDRLTQEFAQTFGLSSQFKVASPVQSPSPKPKFKKPRHQNARKGKRK